MDYTLVASADFTPQGSIYVATRLQSKLYSPHFTPIYDPHFTLVNFPHFTRVYVPHFYTRVYVPHLTPGAAFTLEFIFFTT